MIRYTVGNILDSEADAIVNTVNCEGYMGKGIAYQFKLKYPDNNKCYVKECKSGSFKIGMVLVCQEAGKTIINFPTKDKWRKKSEYSFIRHGMLAFIKELPSMGVKSVAFPPLGCGNGGLDWEEVKKILLEYLMPFQEVFDFVLYEPSANISVVKNSKKVPKLNASHLLLMQMKMGLTKFNKTRLQKGAFMMNLFAGEEYFKFNPYNYGPYAHSIDVLSRDIKEYQEYYNCSTEQAFQMASNTLVSQSVNDKLNKFKHPLHSALEFLNDIKADHELELLSTILYIVSKCRSIEPKMLHGRFSEWSKEKAIRFTPEDIAKGVGALTQKGLLVNSLVGVEVNPALSSVFR